MYICRMNLVRSKRRIYFHLFHNIQLKTLDIKFRAKYLLGTTAMRITSSIVKSNDIILIHCEVS